MEDNGAPVSSVNANPVSVVDPNATQIAQPVENEDQVQPEKSKPFYQEVSFWILLSLVIGLVGLVIFWALPLLQKPFTGEVVMADGQVKLKVMGLSVDKPGYLVVRRVVNGLPDALVEVSQRILPDDYNTFYVVLTYNPGETTEAYYQDMMNSHLRADFFLDSNNDQFFENGVDLEILETSKGKMSIDIINGKSQ